MNVFAKAKASVDAVGTKSSKKGDKRVVEVNNLENYASVCALLTSLEAVKAALELEVKGQVLENFIETGVASKVRPDNFKGVEGVASASCELRKRDSRRALSEDEIQMLDVEGISYDTNEKQVGAYMINPKYSAEQETLEKVAKKLEGIKGLPEDFIIYQPQISTKVVSDTTISQLFQKSKEVVSRLIGVTTTLALKPKMEVENSMEESLNKVRDLLLSE